MADNTIFDLAVLGAGPGGYAAAFRAADFGLSVALIDKELNPGGVCLYKGCIPSKALLHMSYVKEHLQQLENHWLRPGSLPIDPERLRNFKKNVVRQMTEGLAKLSRMRKISYIQGTGSFINSQSLKITSSLGEETVHFKNAIIATGSSPAWPSFLPPSNPKIMDSTAALELEDIPKTLLCLGGGVIGIELASVYLSLGSQVTILEMAPQILPGCDSDMVRFLTRQLKKRGIEIHTQCRLEKINSPDTKIEAHWRAVNSSDNSGFQEFDKMLVCVGRVPNSKNLGIENTEVQISEGGFIALQENFKTHDNCIFALGDVIGSPMLAHKATSEGHRIVEYIIKNRWPDNPVSIPNVVYCYPELAWCGLSENQLKENQTAYKLAKFPWAANGRAASCAEGEGFTKIMFDPVSKKILGAGIYGAGAGEQIALANLCVEMELTLEQISRTVFPHPTLSETFLEAVEMGLGHCDHFWTPKK